MLVISLGVSFDAGKVLVVDVHPAEFNREDVFEAANRIDELGRDLARILFQGGSYERYDMMRQIRCGIDYAKAPSMSPGDFIDVFSTEHGQHVARFVCERTGWVVEDCELDRRPAHLFDGKHVHFCVSSPLPGEVPAHA